MTKEEREYIRQCKDLSEKQLAEKFGISRDTVKGIRKKRKPQEVNFDGYPAEVKFVADNYGRLTVVQMSEAISRVTGNFRSTHWVTRVIAELQRRRSLHAADATEENSEPPKSPWHPIDFGELC